MKISTKGRYALRLMIDLAQHDAGGYIPLRDISRRQEISAKYLEQIVVQLSRAGFVTSTRGAQGGYQLGVTRPSIRWAIFCASRKALSLRLPAWSMNRSTVREQMSVSRSISGADCTM